jgi:hypothetical protein
MNVVTRVAIEGHAKDSDSVAIRMYLKVRIYYVLTFTVLKWQLIVSHTC